MVNANPKSSHRESNPSCVPHASSLGSFLAQPVKHGSHRNAVAQLGIMAEGEEEEEAEEQEDAEIDTSKPRKRLGRPPKTWSSILLPKEVTSTFATHRTRSGKPQKANLSAKSTNPIGEEHPCSKVPLFNMVGQTVHGVVDGCFDKGFLVSLRMGESDHIYRGVVFGPGLLIPVPKETDIAKNVKQKHRQGDQLGATAICREEPSTPPPPILAPPRDEVTPCNLALTQPPQHFEALPPPQPRCHPQLAPENQSISSNPPPSHPYHFAYDGAIHPNNFRSPPPIPDINVNPFMHSGSFSPRPSISMHPSAQGFSPHQNFGHVMPSPGRPYGYDLPGTQGKPGMRLPHYQTPTADPQYRGP